MPVLSKRAENNNQMSCVSSTAAIDLVEKHKLKTENITIECYKIACHTAAQD